METVESLQEKLHALTAIGHRSRLLARGLARGMIWRDGVLPPESPPFSTVLTTDLLDHGFRILDCALSLRQQAPSSSMLDAAFRVAGEAIESAVRRGDSSDAQYGYHLTCAAASFHIGHYSARAYCLLRGDLHSLNLSSPERLLSFLMQRRLSLLADECRSWLESPAHSDEQLALLLQEDEDFGIDDAIFIALAKSFCRAIAIFEFALATGGAPYVAESLALLDRIISAAAEAGHVPMWWVSRLARHLLDDLWNQSYHQRLPTLPSGHPSKWNAKRQDFIDLLACRDLAHIDFWPSQVAAATRAVDPKDDLVAALPTSSGKTRIAELCILRCLAEKRRVVYVTPLRALSAQVEETLAAVFRPLGYTTTAVYGASGIAAADIETLGGADIVVATPEKLDFAIRQDPEVISDVGLIVLDEGHMIGLGEREIRYETLVQRLLRRSDATQRRLVCLSAIFSPGASFDAFNAWIRSGEEGDAIRSSWRPTRQRPGTLVWAGQAARLEYTVEEENVFVPKFLEVQEPKGGRRNPFPQNSAELVVAAADKFLDRGQTVLVYSPTRRSVEPLAKCFLKMAKQGYVSTWLPQRRRPAIEPAVRVGREWLGDEHPAVQALTLGVAVHHGQLPRPFLREIEHLLRDRVLPLAISSPTLAQGVDLSFEVLIISSLWRNRKIIPATEFANVVGRVGRAHVDLDGIYVLPVHESSATKRSQRIREFHGLVQGARHRQMESGLLQLLHYLMTFLGKKLNISPEEVAEYVVNNRDFWSNATAGDEDIDEDIRVFTNELDNGILSSITDLDCSPDDVAAVLDEALADSFWLSRLQEQTPVEKGAQRAILKSRAQWLWRAAGAAQRRGCFCAGIGYAAGETIASNATMLAEAIRDAEVAISEGRVDDAATSTVAIADVLLRTHPFTADCPDGWPDLIEGWLSGRPTGEFADSEAIAFLQDGVVYRLVWAVEAVRVTLEALNDLPEGVVKGNLALCLTFGTPNVTAALLQQAGLRSRKLAVQLVAQLGLVFVDSDGLRKWLCHVSQGEVVPALGGDDLAEWNRFTTTLATEVSARWRRSSTRHTVVWHETSPSPGTLVRASNAADQTAIHILTPDLAHIGTITGHRLPEGGKVVGEVSHDGRHVCLTRFGPQ